MQSHIPVTTSRLHDRKKGREGFVSAELINIRAIVQGNGVKCRLLCRDFKRDINLSDGGGVSRIRCSNFCPGSSETNVLIKANLKLDVPIRNHRCICCSESSCVSLSPVGLIASINISFRNFGTLDVVAIVIAA